MPAIVTEDGVTLYAEETGTGEPLLFIPEFAGDHRSWEYASGSVGTPEGG